MLGLFSIVMEFSDDGDLYQKIVQHQKEKSYFSTLSNQHHYQDNSDIMNTRPPN